MISGISQVNFAGYPLKTANKSFQPPFMSNSLDNKQEKKQNKVKKIILGGIFLGAAVGVSFVAHKQIQLHKLKTKISKNYDEIWKDMLKLIDENKFQIEKPKLKFSNKKSSKSLGFYNPSTNDITINLHHFKNGEYIAYNKEGDVIGKGSHGIFSLQEIENLKKEGVINDSFTVKKLNEAEKMFALNATLVHEQRHCLQFHCVLNDADFGPQYLLKEKAKGLMKDNPNLTLDELIEKVKKEFPYWTNFNPKKNCKNLKLITSLITERGQLALSSKNIARNILEYTSSDIEKYNLNSLEVDANNYALRYLETHPKLKEGCGDLPVRAITRLAGIINAERAKSFVKENQQNIM